MLSAFLLGIIAGGAAGLLMAPKTGKETREDVERYVKEVEGKLNEKKEALKKRYKKDAEAAADEAGS
jgi:gas vesicle protein